MISNKDINESLKRYEVSQEDIAVLKAGLVKLLPELQKEEKNIIEKIKKDYEQKLANAKDNVIKNQAKKIANIFSIQLENSTEDINNLTAENNEKEVE